MLRYKRWSSMVIMNFLYICYLVQLIIAMINLDWYYWTHVVFCFICMYFSDRLVILMESENV